MVTVIPQLDPSAARDFESGRRLVLHDLLRLPGQRRADRGRDPAIANLLERRSVRRQRSEHVAELNLRVGRQRELGNVGGQEPDTIDPEGGLGVGADDLLGVAAHGIFQKTRRLIGRR